MPFRSLTMTTESSSWGAGGQRNSVRESSGAKEQGQREQEAEKEVEKGDMWAGGHVGRWTGRQGIKMHKPSFLTGKLNHYNPTISTSIVHK
jgi:hypothetical protein